MLFWKGSGAELSELGDIMEIFSLDFKSKPILLPLSREESKFHSVRQTEKMLHEV